MWTGSQIKAMKPREGPYRVSEGTDRRGYGRLVIEVKPNGAKYFFFQYFRKQDGKSKKTLVSIGRFKDSAKTVGYSLSDARDVTLEYGNLLKQGLDVRASIEEKQLEQRERIRKIESAKLQGSFSQLIDSYLAAMEADGKRSHESVRSSLRIYLNEPFPEMIKRKANTIEADDMRLAVNLMDRLRMSVLGKPTIKKCECGNEYELFPNQPTKLDTAQINAIKFDVDKIYPGIVEEELDKATGETISNEEYMQAIAKHIMEDEDLTSSIGLFVREQREAAERLRERLDKYLSSNVTPIKKAG